jgi:hypothetical protein
MMPDLAAWQPDVYPFDANIASEALGVVPKANAYAPLPQPATSSLALPAPVRGAIAVRRNDNTIGIYAFTATNAYKVPSSQTGAWTDITRTTGGNYNLATDDYWSMTQYGQQLIATQFNDPVQYIDVNVGTNLAPLPGTPPNAKYVETLGDFVELGNTNVNSVSVKWSGRNDNATWTAYVKDSDSQPFPDGGDVIGLAGMDQGGLIFQADDVRTQIATTSSAIFEFHKLDVARGTQCPYAIVRDGADVYYYSTVGFMRIASMGLGAVTPIGINRVNDWFNGDRNKQRPKAIIGAIDPLVRRIFWLYARSSNATSSVLDGLIIYDIERDQWTHANCALTYIFSAATLGMTLGDVGAAYSSLTAVPYPLGSDVWKGGAPGLAAFDGQNRLCFFNGSPMAATVQTSIFEPISGARSFVKGFRLNGDAATATGKVGGTERPQTAVAWNASWPVNAQGRVPARISTRYAQFEVDVPASAIWTSLAGIEFDSDDVVREGRR